MRTVRILGSEEMLILHLGIHKSRAALSKIIKVIVKRICSHGYTPFVNLMLHIIRPFFGFVNRFFKIFTLSVKKFSGGQRFCSGAFIMKIVRLIFKKVRKKPFSSSFLSIEQDKCQAQILAFSNFSSHLNAFRNCLLISSQICCAVSSSNFCTS